MVCSGSSGSQLSIHCAVGSNEPPAWRCIPLVGPGPDKLPKFVVLFCREKVKSCGHEPAGSLPRAFSDMPCNCRGTSSTSPAEEAAAEGVSLGVDVAGVGRVSSVSWSLSLSDSSPMANVPSSGTSPRVGARESGAVGLLTLSTEVLVELGSKGSAPLSLRCRLRRSISSWPLSRVKDRRASNRFLCLRIE